MYKALILLALLLSFTSQSKSIDITIGEKHTIYSESLSGERAFYVHLPDGYSHSNHQYPTLYILDGQMHFTSAVGMQKSIGNETDVPEMIIIGIENVYPKRRDLTSRKKEKYTLFLKNELIPHIEKLYRTNNERIIFGWEWGSSFSSYLLFQKDQLFNAAISSNGAFSDEKIINEYRALPSGSDKYLYIANSVRDIFTIDSSDKLERLLQEKPIKNIVWQYEKFNNETHSSLPYLAMYHGLRHYYHNFSSLEFYSIQHFEDFGGISAIKAYFKKRAKRFSFSEKIDDSTKNNLIWLSWKRNNFKYFDFFMDEFQDVLSTKRYQSNYWQNRLAQFYLANNDFDKAQFHFEYGIEKFKGNAEIYSGLSQVYYAKKSKTKAISSISKAIEIAKTSKDDNLSRYVSFLEKIK